MMDAEVRLLKAIVWATAVAISAIALVTAVWHVSDNQRDKACIHTPDIERCVKALRR